MSFVRDTFFGGEEKKAGRRGLTEGRAAQTSIQEAGGEAIAGLQPFGTGGQAFQRQQAISGALGPEEQGRAFQQFRESPGQQFIREEGLRFIESGAGASGGLGGGERLRELVKFGTGLAEQGINTEFGRLGEVADRGLGVARDVANLTTGTAASAAGAGIGAVDAFSGGRVAGAAGARRGVSMLADKAKDAVSGALF